MNDFPYYTPPVSGIEGNNQRQGAQRFFTPQEAIILGNMNRDSYRPYRNYVPSAPELTTPRERSLFLVQMWGFAVEELNLFLDTHPNDAEAIRLFQTYRQQYERARKEYERQFGPLCVASDASDAMPWAWLTAPWPWEREE